MSWDVIIPFLRPIEPFLRDPGISDILINGPGCVFIERQGRLQACPEVILTEKALQVAVRNIARVLGDDVGPEKPLLDARLPDGSRVAAVVPPCSVTGTVLSIRKFNGMHYTADELVRAGMLSFQLLGVLRRAVANRQNILISGSTGAGKTTLLAALAAFIAPEERIVIIEDTSEIQIQAANLVRLEARREQPFVAGVPVRDLLKTTLRLRPDRILLGEIRDGAAFDLLQALNTGHSGALSTLHANSASLAISRFTTCVLMSGVDLPYRAIRHQIADVLDLVVHLDRRQGQRLITQVLSVVGYDGARDQYHFDPVFEWEEQR